MILETPFYQVDVFSNELFGGNPLAVFLRGKDFKETQLQQVAREMNLSETTFIFPPSNPQADFDIRIFTPEKEIPFAGHPTLGTAYVLSHTGLVPSTKKDLILNFKAGVNPVTLEENDRIFMIQSSAIILQTFPDMERVAFCLGLNVNNIKSDLPIQSVSTGFPVLIVPINSLRAIQRIILNLPLLKELLEEVEVEMIYPFTRETVNFGNSVHARGFAPFIGIPEDPATGSAAGALGYYLNDKNLEEKEFLIEQGFEIKRSGNISVNITNTEGNKNIIRVGGKIKPVFKGSLYL